MTFEKNIRAWLASITGMTVLQAPYKGSRPSADYVTFQILGTEQMANGYKKTLVGADFRRFTAANMLVSVNVYADKGYQTLADVLASNDDQDARILLREDDVALAFHGGTAPNNLTGFGDTDFRSRWQSDLTFNADLTHDRTAYLIDNIVISGKFEIDGVDTIEIETIADENTGRLDAMIEVVL